MKSKTSLSDPIRLSPFAGKGKNKLVQVVIETPKGSRNKYALDTKQRILELRKVLPAGMDFPYDFGFIPSTRAEDGDPIDVLLLMDESVFPGCLVRARLIGVMLGEQSKIKGKGGTERNDRLLAVAEEESHLYGHIESVDDLEDSFVKELEEFFVNYHCLEGTKFTCSGKGGAAEARKLLQDAIKKPKR